VVQENVGTGRLKGTRFVVPPIVVVGADRRYPVYVGYDIYAHLSRDIPRRPSGLIAAVFEINDVLGGDPIGRVSRPGHCFGQSMLADHNLYRSLPLTKGEEVRVTLTSLDAHGQADGELSMTVKLRAAPHRAANDISPLPFPREIGC
jgi:hypothetical protein